MPRVVYVFTAGRFTVRISREHEGYSFPLGGVDYGFYESLDAAIRAAEYHAHETKRAA